MTPTLLPSLALLSFPVGSSLHRIHRCSALKHMRERTRLTRWQCSRASFSFMTTVMTTMEFDESHFHWRVLSRSGPKSSDCQDLLSFQSPNRTKVSASGIIYQVSRNKVVLLSRSELEICDSETETRLRGPNTCRCKNGCASSPKGQEGFRNLGKCKFPFLELAPQR